MECLGIENCGMMEGILSDHCENSDRKRKERILNERKERVAK